MEIQWKGQVLWMLIGNRYRQKLNYSNKKKSSLLDGLYKKEAFHSQRAFFQIFFQKKKKFANSCKKASLTVEAAVILPFFVCFLVFVLYFFRILQVQAGISQALQFAGRKAAAECSTKPQQEQAAGSGLETSKGKKVLDGLEVSDGQSLAGTGISDSQSLAVQEGSGVPGRQSLTELIKAKAYFHQQLKKQGCPTQYIQSGAAGISLLQSDVSGNYIDLKAVYRMKLPVGLLGNVQYRIVQEAKCRKWTGYQLGQEGQESDIWLYYTEYGTVYHASRSCTHLDLSIKGVTYAQAGSSRNNSGGKYHPCEKCKHGSVRGMVYITNYGDRYHSSLTCSGLKRNIFMIRRSQAFGKKMCSKCGG